MPTRLEKFEYCCATVMIKTGLIMERLTAMLVRACSALRRQQGGRTRVRQSLSRVREDRAFPVASRVFDKERIWNVSMTHQPQLYPGPRSATHYLKHIIDIMPALPNEVSIRLGATTSKQQRKRSSTTPRASPTIRAWLRRCLRRYKTPRRPKSRTRPM